MDIQVSVVVPVYNVEKYLSHCLESILGQKGVELEVICVEDCSTDNSREVLKKYALRDNRIHTVYHDVNKGLSISRNDGIHEAKGKYIWFVDSDDFILEKSVKRLYDCAEYSNLDMISFGMECIFENAELAQKYPVSKSRYNKKYGSVCDGQKILASLLLNSEFVYGCVPRYFFKREFLIKESIFFKEELLFEDNLYMFLCYLKAKRVRCVNESFYCRLRREGSITTSESERVRAKSLFICYEEIWKAIAKTELSDSGKFGISEILSNLGIIIKNIAEKEKIGYEGENPLERYLWNLICEDTKRKTIEMRVMEFMKMKRERRLYIYGAGTYAEEVFRELNRLEVTIDGVIVTGKENNKKSIWGHPVREFKEFNGALGDAAIFVAIAGEAGREIEMMLRKSGVRSVFTIE